MKTKIFTILLALSVILMTASIAAADGSYPLPRFYPIGQTYPDYSYTPPVNYYNGQTTSETPFYNNPQPNPNYNQNQYYYPPQNQYNYPPQNQYYPQQNQYYYPGPNCGMPYYDPYTGQYYSIPCQPQNQQPYRPQQQSNVQVSTRPGKNNTTDLTWTIRNITNGDWSSAEVDILCKDGCHLLTGSRTRWDIPYTVSRNGDLSFTVNIRQPWPGDHMTFSMVAGSTVLYTFSVYPY